MDAIDCRIIATLHCDGRPILNELSKGVGVSPKPPARRIARLQGQGFIAGPAAHIDQEKLDLPLGAFIFVEPRHHSRDAGNVFEDRLMQMHNIRAMRSNFAPRTMIRRDALPEV